MLSKIEIESILDKVSHRVPLTSAETSALVASLDKLELRNMVLLRPLEAQGDKRTFVEMAFVELLKRGRTVRTTWTARRG